MSQWPFLLFFFICFLSHFGALADPYSRPYIDKPSNFQISKNYLKKKKAIHMPNGLNIFAGLILSIHKLVLAMDSPIWGLFGGDMHHQHPPPAYCDTDITIIKSLKFWDPYRTRTSRKWRNPFFFCGREVVISDKNPQKNINMTCVHSAIKSVSNCLSFGKLSILSHAKIHEVKWSI